MFEIKIDNKNYNTDDVVATIGNFDGMHLGHQSLLSEVYKISKAQNIKSMVITFEPLPKEFIRKDNQLLRLSLLRDKYYFTKKFLINSFVILRFNYELQHLDAKDFITNILLTKLKVKYLVIGNDFHFGYKAKGSINLLREYGVHVIETPTCVLHNNRISSSLIRHYAKDNCFEDVKALLGHNICYTSRVVYGNQLGRKYGVPTINLLLINKIPVLWGIYLAYVYIEGTQYKSVVSCGQNPTVTNTKNYKLEAHLLDVDLDLYGKIATIEILDFLRPELKFDNLEQLFLQIHQDLQDARNYFYRLK